MRHTQKSKLSPSLGCIQILKNGKRKSTSVSLYSIQMEKLFTLWSFGVPMKTAGNTGVALQGLAKYCLNVFVAYNWKWNIFVDLWHVWTHEVLWWFYNLNSHGNYLQRGTASHNYIETDLSVLTMTFWDTRKIVGRWLHVIIGAMWIARPWRVTSAGSVLDCPIKVGGESTVFSTLLVLYSQLNYCVSCYAGFDGWW